MQISKLETPLPVMGRKTTNQMDTIRRELVTIGVSEGIRVLFDTSKRSMGAYIAAVVKPLAPRKFSYRTLDDQSATRGRVIGIWRTK